MLRGEPPASPRLLKNVLVASKGRAPWYNIDGQTLDAFVIGVAGGSSSGKTTVAREILRRIDVPWVVIVSQDSFYKNLTPEQSARAFQNLHDFDSPDAFDNDGLRRCIIDLRSCRSTNIPTYDFSTHSRTKRTHYLYGAAVIILEGIFVLHDPQIRDLLDLKVFVQCDSDLMLARRIRRDIEERGRDVSGVLDQYMRFVKPSYDNHVMPTSRHADVIVPGSSNSVAIDLITTHVRRQLDERSLKTRSHLGKIAISTPNKVSPEDSRLYSSFPFDNLPDTVNVMKRTSQILGMHTILRSKDTTRDEFVFTSDRLATLIIEHVLEFIPLCARPYTATVQPNSSIPATEEYVCGVTIARSGTCLERGLRRVVRDIPVGSILIQSDEDSGEPFLYNVHLPESVRDHATAPNTYVILMDSQIGTGASALMAIRVLLDHRVKQENIVFACFLLSTQGGVRNISRTFPKIRIVTSDADNALEERLISTTMSDGTPYRKRVWAIIPGMGSFGDRYFGTGSSYT